MGAPEQFNFQIKPSLDRYNGRTTRESRRKRSNQVLTSLSAGAIAVVVVVLSITYAVSTPATKESYSDLLLVMLILLSDAIVCGFLGYLMGKAKRTEVTGFALGFVFGPIGLLVMLALDARPTCHQCGSRLNGAPRICPFCHAQQQAGRQDNKPMRIDL